MVCNIKPFDVIHQTMWRFTAPALSRQTLHKKKAEKW
jgi:hypothetical protein